MFCHVLTGVLFFTVLICKESFGVDESESSPAVQLNEILKNPGWEQITHVGAKCQPAVNRNGSFDGKDLLVSDTNLLTSKENFRHYMVTHLVGCVYANAVMKFISLIKDIMEEFGRAKKAVVNQAACLKRKNLVEDGRENFVDYQEAWTIFNYALHQLFDNRQTFGRMFSAMRYLIDTIPLGVYTLDMLDGVMPCLEQFKDVSKDIKEVLGSEYTGPMDPDYNRKVSLLPRRLLLFLNVHAKTAMGSFLKNYCTVWETSARPSVKGKNITKLTPTAVAFQCGAEIKQLMDKVGDIYYSQLGFMYNEAEQTTYFMRNQPSQPIS